MELEKILLKGKDKIPLYEENKEALLDFPRLPTGIFAIDYMIGGGFPIGVSSCIYGPPSGGKNTTITKLIYACQNICWNCFEYLWDCSCGKQEVKKTVLVSLEGVDLFWMKVLGVDLDKLFIIEPESGEQAVDVICDCIQADDCGLVVLDSLAMLTPLVEIKASALESQIGLQARLISKFIRRLKSLMIIERKKEHKVAFVATNQVRTKIGQLYGSTEEVPGGYTSKHDWHLMFRTSQIKSDKEDDENMKLEIKFSISLNASMNKKKLRVFGSNGEYYFSVSPKNTFPIGYANDIKTVLQYAEDIGLYSTNPFIFNGERFDKKQDLIDLWRTNPKRFLSDKKKVIDKYIEKYNKEMLQGMQDYALS